MTREQALSRLIEVVRTGARHPWYKRTVELASLYRKLVTGDGLDDLLKQFVKREDEESFEQRKRLTQHIVTAVVKNIMDVIDKVPRANYKRVLEHGASAPKNATQELENVIDTFWGTKSLDSYHNTRYLEINSWDPNRFEVIEFKPFDNKRERARPYPCEVSSAAAIDYTYENNVLQYLTVLSTFPLPTKTDPKKQGEKYTLYLANETLVLTEIDPQEVIIALLKDGEFIQAGDYTYLLLGKRVLLLTETMPHNAGEVPAMQFGYLRDPFTEGETFLAPYHAAVPILMKSIKVNSEMDLTMSLCAFQFRAEYAPKCKADGCHGGFLENGSQCSSCRGSGHDSVTSAQEKLVLTLPRPGDPMHDLDKLVVFKGPNVDIIQFQKDYIESLTAQSKSVVFNTDIFSKKQISDTATGQNIELNNVYDTLYKCSIGYSEFWQFMVRLTAKFTSLDKGLIAELLFNKDFKLKGLSELLADLESANRSESGPAVKQYIQADIARLIYAENPFGFIKWQTKQAFNPFAGYSEAEVALALTDAAVPQRFKTQYLMAGILFDDLEFDFAQNGVDFYAIPVAEQRKAVFDKVASYMAESGINARPVLGATAPSVN